MLYMYYVRYILVNIYGFLGYIIQNGNQYLLRGPPVCGKTTLAQAL